MDTLHFDQSPYHTPHPGRAFRDDEAQRVDQTNLSELEVFMLRGRRLQAQVIGEGLGKAFAKLGRLLSRSP